MAPSDVAVITPYYNEGPDCLMVCHQSVRQQALPCSHVMVADGKPSSFVDSCLCEHLILPRPHSDKGSTARLIGCYYAIGLNVDCLLFLDADNWYHQSHLETLVGIRRATGAAVVSSARLLCRLDGTVMGRCPLIDPGHFVDTNCMLIGREAFHLLDRFVLMPAYGHLIGDRIFWRHVLDSGLHCVHSDSPTVYYRCKYSGLYGLMGEEPPDGVDPDPDYVSAHQQWLEDGNPALF